MERLAEKTDGTVVRTDRALPAEKGPFSFVANDLYYEVSF